MSKETIVKVKTEIDAHVDDLKKIENKIARLLAEYIKNDLARSNNPESAIRNMLSSVPEEIQKDVLISAIANLAHTLNSGSGSTQYDKTGQRPGPKSKGFWE